MTSLVAEIPGYLHGTNPLSIAAVTRRLANILALSTDLDSLRTMATDWEMQVSSKVEIKYASWKSNTTTNCSMSQIERIDRGD